jgi:hypothetical protein
VAASLARLTVTENDASEAITRSATALQPTAAMTVDRAVAPALLEDVAAADQHQRPDGEDSRVDGDHQLGVLRRDGHEGCP